MIKNANDKDAVILDVGTGQGGDVDKWKRVKYVYCIEPAWKSSSEMLRRFAGFAALPPHTTGRESAGGGRAAPAGMAHRTVALTALCLLLSTAHGQIPKPLQVLPRLALPW